MRGELQANMLPLFHRLVWLGLIVAIGSTSTTVFGAQPAFPTQISSKDFVAFVRNIKLDDKEIAAAVNEIFAQRVVIFIPGILGSKLSAPDGRPIWGYKSKASVSSLAVSGATSPATATILDSYPLLGITRQDIYGEFDRLEVIATGGDFERLEFAYDWREDIDVLADKFEKQVRGDWGDRLKGKTVVIVAHSTGGIIAWQWKNRYLRSGKHDFTVGKLVLVGVPLHGSCEMLRMLLTGYRPTPGAGFFEDKMYRYLFSELRPAAYTFTSVFQLLPSDETTDLKQRCLMAEEESGTYEQNHFSIATWKKLLLPFLQKGQPVWRELGETQDAFMQRLERLLIRAKDFRKKLDRDLSEAPLEKRVEYFYSGQHETTYQLTIAKSDVDESKGTQKDGDGRVMANSAKNSGRFLTTPRALLANHGDLVKDPIFIRFLSDELKQDWGRTSRELSMAIAESQNIRALFAKNGLILSLSELGFNPEVIAAREREPDQRNRELQAVLRLNETTLMEFSKRRENRKYADPNPFVFAYRYARHIDDNKKNKAAAVPLYETVLASGALRNTPNETYALNRYGFAQYTLGRTENAYWPVAMAYSNVKESTGVYTEEFRNTVAKNVVATRNMVLKDIGVIEAADYYEKKWGSGFKGKVAEEFREGKM